MPRLALLFLVCILPTLHAADPIDYRREVKPILESRCASCHGALQQKAGLRLDASSLIRKGSRNGPVIVPGKSDDSTLIDAVLGKDRSRMPPEKEGPALTDKQIASLRAWIDQGAKMPDESIPEDPRRHWAFVKPVRAALPVVRAATSGNPIDVFLAARREKAGIEPMPEAGRDALLRRVTFDLTGLPPTPEERRVFLDDASPDAYEKVVERLLASPRHGERWARHWMDVWRYSDWYGRRSVPDVWNSAPQVHRWRDWIVRSLNADRGYDRMVREMLAGDEIAPEDDAARDATGYLVRNWYALNPNQWMRDNVEHVGKAFLGLTFNCAHCHDHKYDPISQEEYFRFRACFEPLGLRQDRVPGEADPGAFQKYDYSTLRRVVKTGAIRVHDENPEAKTIMYNLGDERDPIKGKPPVSPGAPAFLGGSSLKIEKVAVPALVRHPGLREEFRREDVARLESAVRAAEAKVRSSTSGPRLALGPLAVLPWPPLRAAEAGLARARAQLVSYRARMTADDAKHAGRGDLAVVGREAARAEHLANLAAAEERLALADLAVASAADEAALKKARTEATAAKTALVALKKPRPESSTWTPLAPSYAATSTGRRKALAEWMTSRDNPLTARVAVNHVWKHYFSRPLVETVSDLGRNGAKPTHPELIDRLAVELMDAGWSMKHLHRLIVLSAAYRMSSAHDEAAARSDPDNRLLWRFPSRRLEAESLRDAVLFCAGELDATMFGPSLDNVADADSRRRSLYFSVYPEGGGHQRFLDLFDPPDPCDCYKRSANVVPQQALALTNSRLLLDNSRLLARRAGKETSEIDFIRSTFERLLGRAPTDGERETCREFLRRQEKHYRDTKTVPVASPEATVPPSADPALRARESLVRVLFNHDEFLNVR